MILPTLKQLEYLVALADAGHFGRAATRAHVTQSTLSAGIAELERLLGATLVERGRRIVLTPVGARVATRARDLLRDAEALVEAAYLGGRPLTGALRLGIIPTIAPYLLPRVLPGLRAQYPELKLYLRELASGPACEALARGHLDAVLLALPFACGDVETAHLLRDPFHVAFAPGDLEGPPPTVHPDALAPERLLLLEDGHCLKDQAIAACGRPELRADAAVLGTSLLTLVQMVDNGLGMTLLPEMALDAGILMGTRVLARPLDAPGAARMIALVWRRTSPRAGEFTALAEALKAGAANARTEAR